MKNNHKLSDGHRHMLRLALKDANCHGFASVSATVWPEILKIPDELLDKLPGENGGHVRVTKEGKAVLKYT